MRTACIPAILLAISTTLHATDAASNAPTTPVLNESMIDRAQQEWCDGLIGISKLYREGGDYKAAANRMLDDLYDYNEGRVFFKPTLAHGPHSFRPTRAGALSYFIGGNKDFPDDTGFALRDWREASYDNNADENGIQIHGNIGIAMGHVFLTDGKGNKVTVEKTFVFRHCPDGKLRLCVHKSALPFTPAVVPPVQSN